MRKPQTKDCLTLDLKGKLPLEKFEKALVAFFDLIKEVTKAALKEKQKILWTITVRSGSATVNAIPHYEENVSAQAREILHAVPSGIKALEHGAKTMPPLFTRAAVRAVKTLGSVQDLRGDDVTSVRIRSLSAKALVTPKSATAAEALITGQRQSYGSIEGRLQTITERGGFRFVVYDSLYDHRVDCFIDEDLMAQAVASFGKRVRVSGLVQYDHFGDPVSIKVDEDIFTFPSNKDLPSVREMRGILKGA
jgi:hypothetical protein